MFKYEHNVETGEIKEIELTESEIKEQEKLAAAQLKKEKDAESVAEIEKAKKEAIASKLGLNLDEVLTLLS